MPNVARSWYANTAYGADYFTFVLDELPTVCRSYFKGMSDLPEDNYVGGLSMGGYGALKASLVCPERFGACASLSGALDIAEFSKYAETSEWRGIFGFDLDCSKKLTGTEHDIYALAKKNAENAVPFPKLFMWCGLDDDLIGSNRRFDALLSENGIEHVYAESEGDHSWEWWDKHIQDAINFFVS
jgi:putative tributyrin esterase